MKHVTLKKKKHGFITLWCTENEMWNIHPFNYSIWEELNYLLTKCSSLSTSLDNKPSTLLSSWCVINMSTSCPEVLPLSQGETEINIIAYLTNKNSWSNYMRLLKLHIILITNLAQLYHIIVKERDVTKPTLCNCYNYIKQQKVVC